MAPPNFSPRSSSPIVHSFKDAYCSRGLSSAIARGIFHTLRSEHWEVSGWCQIPLKSATLLCMFPTSMIAIVETVIRIAGMISLGFLYFIPKTTSFYQREFLDLTEKSMANIFILMIASVGQLAMDVEEISQEKSWP